MKKSIIVLFVLIFVTFLCTGCNDGKVEEKEHDVDLKYDYDLSDDELYENGEMTIMGNILKSREAKDLQNVDTLHNYVNRVMNYVDVYDEVEDLTESGFTVVSLNDLYAGETEFEYLESYLKDELDKLPNLNADCNKNGEFAIVFHKGISIVCSVCIVNDDNEVIYAEITKNSDGNPIAFWAGNFNCNEYMNSNKPSVKNTTVPDVVGRDEISAGVLLSTSDLKYTIKREPNDEVDAGYVIKQSIEAGKEVSKNTTVIITISEGGTVFEIPDVVGMTYEEANMVLSNKGLVVDVKYEMSEEYETNTVFKTNPEQPIKLKKGDKITVYVSLGNDDIIEIPDVIGKTGDEAKEILESIGFNVLIIEEQNSSVPKGRVISMDLEPGMKIPKGETITLVVSLGN